MNVLVIPEDFRVDQYILRPIISAMMANLGERGRKSASVSTPCLAAWNRL